MAIRLLAGYMAPDDSGKYSILADVDGPASYNNTGTFLTSGQQLNASDFGVGGFESVGVDSLTSDALNEVMPVLGGTIAGATNLNPAPGAGQPAPVPTTCVLHWYTGVRGIGGTTEVANTTNLSGKSVRLRIIAV